MPESETPVQECLPPTARAIFGVQLGPRLPDEDYPSALVGGPIIDINVSGPGITPYTIRRTPQFFAAEASVVCDPAIAEYTQPLRVDTDGVSKLLMQHGQSENSARSLKIAFVQAQKLRDAYEVPRNAQVKGWSEPQIVWRGESEERGPLGFANFIGVPISGPEDLTESGLEELNRNFLHELGHCATRTSPLTPNLYQRDENGEFLPYRNKRVFGVVPVALAVTYLKRRGHSEFTALWQLDPSERRARAFERKHAGRQILTLAHE